MACLSCAWEESNGTKIDTSRSKTEWGQRIGVSEAAIRRHLMHPGTISIPSEPNLGVRGDSKSIDTTGTVKITKTADRIIPLSEWLDDLRDDGHDPDQFNCSHAHSVWGQQSTENGLITLYANRFTAVKKTRKEALEEVFDYANIDPVGILAQLRADRHPISPAWEEGGDESTFVLSINDIQLGQSYNGGSAATIANFYRYIELAKRRISDLRVLGRSLDTVVFVIGGDLVEGCVIYPNQSFSLDLNRKQQIKGVIGLLLHAFDELVPMFQRARVLAPSAPSTRAFAPISMC